MSNIHHTALVPATRQREVIIPPMSKGLSDVNGNVDSNSGFGKTLTNCSYVGGQLVMGRPGLDFEWFGASLGVPVIRGIDESDLYIDSNGNDTYGTTGIFGFCATSTKIYKKNQPAPGNGYNSLALIYDCATNSVGTINDIVYFDNILVILTTTGLYAWTDLGIYFLGSMYNNLAARTSTETKAYSGTPAALAIDTQTILTNIDLVSVRVKKVGTITGMVRATIVDFSGKTFGSLEVNIDTEILSDYAVVDFIFPEGTTLIGGELVYGWTEWMINFFANDLTFTTSGGDSSNYLAFAIDSDGDPIISINGEEVPTGIQLSVFNQQLYVAGDITTNKVWFSNYNAPNDFFTTSSDGMITYGGYLGVGDSDIAQSFGVFSYGQLVAIVGYAHNDYVTTFYDRNHSLTHRLKGVRLGGEYSVSTKYGVFFISEGGEVGVLTSLPVDGEAQITWISSRIQEELNSLGTLSIDGRITFNSKLSQVYVHINESSDVYVCQMPGGQWTKYTFTGKEITYLRGNKMGTKSGDEFTIERTFSATDENVRALRTDTQTYTDIVPVAETHKCRFSRFHRTQLHQFLWDIENDGFSGLVTIQSEMGNSNVTKSIAGNPPKAHSVMVKDTGFNFKLSSITIDEYTPVGEIAMMVSTEGRSN